MIGCLRINWHGKLQTQDAKRDWGHAKDYVYAMWLLLQQEQPQDYVIASNETRTVREFVETAFRCLDIIIVWEGEGIHEVGKNQADGKVLVKVNPEFFRPAEVELLWGNPARAETELGWERKISFENLVERMAASDMKLVERERQIKNYR